MAEYDYNFNMFDEGTSAPKAVPQKKARPAQRLQLVEETREVIRERVQISEKRNFISSLLIISVAIVLTAVVSSFIYLGASINEYDHKIASVQEELDIAQSQNVILNIKKDSMVSFDSVRETAEELGMIQRDRYQVTYFELAKEDYGVVK
ncbi:MAG: hypothetical protein J6L89_06115 [Clostridia bacterium]|nr:hypothetical protein [Clostridia bacterium]